MRYFPAALERLTEQFAKLPGIGGKTAQRLAFYLLSLPAEETQEFADAMIGGVLPTLTDSQQKLYDKIAALA